MNDAVKRRPSSPKPLAELIDACLGETLAKQGFAGSDIILNWPEIVGEALARRSRPIRVAWARKPVGSATPKGRSQPPPEPATLHVRVESAFALELQHLAPLVIERVNSYFGWACVGRLRLEQGPVGRGQAGPPRRIQPSPETIAAAEAAAHGVVDDGLRAALVRLGAAVMDRERAARTKS